MRKPGGEYGAAVVGFYAKVAPSRGDTSEAQLLTDMLTDLMHYAAEEGLDFAVCLQHAMEVALAERPPGSLPLGGIAAWD